MEIKFEKRPDKKNIVRDMRVRYTAKIENLRMIARGSDMRLLM